MEKLLRLKGLLTSSTSLGSTYSLARPRTRGKVSLNKKKLSLDTRIKFMKHSTTKPNNAVQPNFSNFSINLLGNRESQQESPELSEILSPMNTFDATLSNKCSFAEFRIAGLEEGHHPTSKNESKFWLPNHRPYQK